MKEQKETEGILWICSLSYHMFERGKEEQMEDDFIFKEVAIDFWMSFYFIFWWCDMGSFLLIELEKIGNVV